MQNTILKTGPMNKVYMVIMAIVLATSACVSAARQNRGTQPVSSVSIPRAREIAPSPGTSETLDLVLADQKPQSLMNLPVSERGEIILSAGFYEAAFQSYCLQPGTPDPSSRDAYLQAPLAGPRADILETALRNSIQKPWLDQKNIQLLLWCVVSGSNFDQLAPSVKNTARQLLTPKQIFALKGGWMSVARNVVQYLPDGSGAGSYRQIQNLFELGQQSYEAYERIAVLREPSVIRHPEYKRDQWYRHADGYFVRYFPQDYKMVHVQVFVPGDLLDDTGMVNGNYLLFDPVRQMAVPANSNAQRLGIGAPVTDILRTVIQIHRQKEADKRQQKTPKPEPPKPVVMK
jgi:hypothetical protein